MKRCILLACMVFIACEKDPVAVNLTPDGEFQIRPAIVRAVAGDRLTLAAVGFSDDGQPAFPGEITWTSLDTAVLAVLSDNSINVRRAGWGRVEARAAVGGQTDTSIVAAGLRFTELALDDGIGCGMEADGRAYCWGSTFRGALGTGIREGSPVPMPVAGELRFSEIDVSNQYSCGIVEGKVYCWGYANIGNGPGLRNCSYSAPCTTPRPVETVSLPGTWHTVRVTGNSATCAAGDVGVRCWGDPGHRARLRTDCESCDAAVIAAQLTGPMDLGTSHGCALTAVGRAYCWGENRSGQLGTTIPLEYCANGGCTASTTALPVDIAEQFTDIASSSEFNCARTEGGRVFCWGTYRRYSFSGSAGLPGPTPVQVGGNLRFESIAAGGSHVCGLTSPGELYCWGTGADRGALGEPVMPYGDMVPEPRRVGAGMRFTHVKPGAGATCAISADGGTFCFGSGWEMGQLDANVRSSMPLPLMPPAPIPDYALDPTRWF